MDVFPLCLVLFLAMTAHSSATYCVCKDGLSDSVYQKNLDYACGAGADCTPITQNGACYNPNTVKDHCNYAVNSYFQRKGQTTGSCDFAGTASTVSALSSQPSSTCVYPSTASPAGTTPTTPTTTPTSPTTTPTTPTTTPTTPTSGTTTPTSTPPSTTGTPSTIFGLSPSSITPTGDSKAHLDRPLFWTSTVTLLISGPMLWLSL